MLFFNPDNFDLERLDFATDQGIYARRAGAYIDMWPTEYENNADME